LPAQIWKAAMLTAEKGLPLHGLNRSPPEAPHVQEELLASEPSGQVIAGDDESSGALARAEPPPPEMERPRHRDAFGRVLGWLFGDDDDQRAPARPER
jgi:hypothetical protein